MLCRCMNTYEAHISLALNRSSVIRRFEGSDVIEIRDGITFDFYTGLPHTCMPDILQPGQLMRLHMHGLSFTPKSFLRVCYHEMLEFDWSV